MRVLLVEDEPLLADFVAKGLREGGHAVDHAASGPDGLHLAETERYDAWILDRMLPGLEGIKVVEALRRQQIDTPVLMISALSEVDDRIRGLRAGGDDYLTKPFAPDEMAARAEVLLRRRQPQQHETRLRVGELELDRVRHVAYRQGQPLTLQPTEYRLLEYLMRHSGQVLTRTMIFEAVWGFHFDPGTNVIDVHIGRLRRKIDGTGQAPLIRTVRGTGYMITSAPQNAAAQP